MFQKNKKIRVFNPSRFLAVHGESLGNHFIEKSRTYTTESMVGTLRRLGHIFLNMDRMPTETIRREVNGHLEKAMKIKFEDLPLHINNHKLVQSTIIEWRFKNGI